MPPEPAGPEATYGRARTLYDSGDFEGAVPLLSQLLEEDPTNPELLRALAAAQFKLGRYGESERAYRLVLARLPTSYEAAHFLALSIERQGRVEEAVVAHQTAAALKTPPESTNAVGNATRQRQDIDAGDAGGQTGRLSEANVTVRGQARHVQQRFQMWTDLLGRSMCSFRLVPEDERRSVVVEMRGKAFQGSLSEGDRVQVTGRLRNNTIRTRRLVNETTGSAVVARNYYWVYALKIVPFLVLLAVGLWFEFLSPNATEATITVTPSIGEPGTVLSIEGTDFRPDEIVRIRFHTVELVAVHADGDGRISVRGRIPEDWPSDGQFDVVAAGDSSWKDPRELVTVRNAEARAAKRAEVERERMRQRCLKSGGSEKSCNWVYGP